MERYTVLQGVVVIKTYYKYGISVAGLNTKPNNRHVLAGDVLVSDIANTATVAFEPVVYHPQNKHGLFIGFCHTLPPFYKQTNETTTGA